MTTPKPLEPTTITRLLRGLDLEQEKLIKFHKTRMQVIEVKRKELQARCKHNWHYQPDPSGNNDSSWECVVCRLMSRSNPTKE